MPHKQARTSPAVATRSAGRLFRPVLDYIFFVDLTLILRCGECPEVLEVLAINETLTAAIAFAVGYGSRALSTPIIFLTGLVSKS